MNKVDQPQTTYNIGGNSSNPYEFRNGKLDHVQVPLLRKVAIANNLNRARIVEIFERLVIAMENTKTENERESFWLVESVSCLTRKRFDVINKEELQGYAKQYKTCSDDELNLLLTKEKRGMMNIAIDADSRYKIGFNDIITDGMKSILEKIKMEGHEGKETTALAYTTALLKELPEGALFSLFKTSKLIDSTDGKLGRFEIICQKLGHLEKLNVLGNSKALEGNSFENVGNNLCANIFGDQGIFKDFKEKSSKALVYTEAKKAYDDNKDNKNSEDLKIAMNLALKETLKDIPTFHAGVEKDFTEKFKKLEDKDIPFNLTKAHIKPLFSYEGLALVYLLNELVNMKVVIKDVDDITRINEDKRAFSEMMTTEKKIEMLRSKTANSSVVFIQENIPKVTENVFAADHYNCSGSENCVMYIKKEVGNFVSIEGDDQKVLNTWTSKSKMNVQWVEKEVTSQ